jgi:SAM domain (Sterile alpha motif)
MTNINHANLLTSWLSEQGMQSYESLFHSNDITFELLANTTADDLREIGIQSVGHRRILLIAIERLPNRHPQHK